MPLKSHRCAYCKRESVCSPEPGNPSTWLPAGWHLEAGPGNKDSEVIVLCHPRAVTLGRVCAVCDEDIERCECDV